MDADSGAEIGGVCEEFCEDIVHFDGVGDELGGDEEDDIMMERLL